jgi:lambda repressor-like predicted transcriptional regulator
MFIDPLYMTGKDIGKELKEQGRSVAWLARTTGIPATTLRSAISRNSNCFKENNRLKILTALGIVTDTEHTKNLYCPMCGRKLEREVEHE